MVIFAALLLTTRVERDFFRARTIDIPDRFIGGDILYI
jgi:hypothetical protein